MTDLELAHLLADAADHATLSAYSGDTFMIDTKPDGTVVTTVERELEAGLVDLVRMHRPHEAVLGQELGAAGEGPPAWLLDPIEGTASFATGEPDWATHVARVAGEDVELGVVSSPALEHRWWAAAGEGAWAVTPGTGDQPTRLRVSPMDVVGGARIAAWPPPRGLGGEDRERLERFHRAAAGSAADLRGVEIKPTRDTGFPSAAVMVAAGALDGCVLLGGGPWSLAPLVALVEEAGGRFSDPLGGRRLDLRGGVFSNGLIHDDMVSWLR